MFNGATVTLAGYVATEPNYRTINDTTPIVSMRVAWTSRFIDRETGEWPRMLSRSRWVGPPAPDARPSDPGSARTPTARLRKSWRRTGWGSGCPVPRRSSPSSSRAGPRSGSC